jgi:hypothetical protein
VHKFITTARNRGLSALHAQSRCGHQTPNRTLHVARSHNRHPELGSGSISRLYPSVYVARWMLNRVQHDIVGNASLRPLRLCVNSLICHSRESGNPWAELSAKWFAQRHEGIKKLLPVFVSLCEPKSYRARKYKTMGSRFRGNDNFGVLGCVSEYSRRPELGSGSISPLVPSGSVARWMLKQVQHDVVGNAPLRPPRLCVNPFCRPSGGWGLSRSEGLHDDCRLAQQSLITLLRQRPANTSAVISKLRLRFS